MHDIAFNNTALTFIRHFIVVRKHEKDITVCDFDYKFCCLNVDFLKRRINGNLL